MEPQKKPKFGGAKAPPDGGRFAHALGSFMMNCGVLEFQSYQWIMVLSPNLKLPDGVGEMRFSHRMEWIHKEIK